MTRASGAGGCWPALSGHKALVEHQPYLTSSTSQIVLAGYLQGGTPPDPASPASLTPREREITQLLADGKSNKEVAARLELTVKAVESQRAAIMNKLGLTAFSELVRYAVRNQLVEL